VFVTQLVSGLEGIPGLESESVVSLGATDITTAIAPQYLDRVVAIYNKALTRTFDVGLALSCIMIVGAVGMEWKSIKKDKGQESGSKTG
jgi:hypothetical protein